MNDYRLLKSKYGIEGTGGLAAVGKDVSGLGRQKPKGRNGEKKLTTRTRG